MVYLDLIDPLHIQINANIVYMEQIRDFFSFYPDGFQFSQKYLTTKWDGRVCLIRKNIFPYGLINEVVKYHKKYCSDEKLKISPSISKLFNGDIKQYKKNLKLKPWKHQDEAIKKALRLQKCIIRSCTASGKSLIIAYILNRLKSVYKKQLIIVPSKGLVAQFYKDLISYNIDKNIIGKIYAKEKIYDRPITIATWQSLQNNIALMKQYKTVIVDEVHGVKAVKLTEIMKEATNAVYRLGFTGTLPYNELKRLNVLSYIGPVVADYSASFLSKLGYVANCNIHQINIRYAYDDYRFMNYYEVQDEVFNNKFRYNVIKKIIDSVDNSILILVSKVKNEGEFLYKKICEDIKDKEIIFLSGRDKVKLREEWRNKCDKQNNVVIIATFGIFSVGINIKSLKYLIFGSSTKSEIRTLQSIGRALRLHEDKINGAHIFDIVDDVKYLREHARERLNFYKQEQFPVKTLNLTEDCSLDRINLNIY